MDRLDWIVIVGSVLLLFGGTVLLLFLAAYRRPRGPGQQLVSRGAGRIVLRSFTRGGSSQRWN